jgi:hypothetical protein
VPPATDLAAFLAGFVTAEGTFGFVAPRTFRFAISLGACDSEACDLLQEYFDVGTIHVFRRRRLHYDDEVTFQVRKLRDLVEVVVPFMDEHLPPSHKREQYLAWRGLLLDYWEHRARRRRPCRVDGCLEPSRAKGLCRRHYFAEYGR